MKARTTIRILVLLLLAACTIASIVHVPPRAGDTSWLVPPQAGFALHERGLADRLDQVLESPLATSLLRTLGMDEAGVRALGQDARTLAYIRELLGRDAVLAYMPEGASGRDGEWMLASDVGIGHLKWRWLLNTGRLTGARAIGTHHGHTLWNIPLAGLPEGRQLHCSVMEGVLLASLSDDETALRRLIDRYDVLVYLPAETDPLYGFAPGAQTRGWLRQGPGELLRFVLELAGRGGLRARLEKEGAGLSKQPAADLAGDPGKFLAGLPQPLAALAVHPELLRLMQTAGILLPPTGEWLLEALAGSRCAALLAYDDPYESRLKGLKTPFLLLAVRMPGDGPPAAERVSGLLDRINAAYQQGLIVGQLPMDGLSDLHVFESTKDTPYSRLPARERMAYVQQGEWLLVGTHAQSLARLLAVRRVNEPREADWLASLERGGVGVGWLDLERAGARISALFTLQAMAMGFRDPRAGAEWVKRAQAVKAWTDAMAPLGQGSFLLSFEPGLAVLHLEAGISEH